MSIDSSANLLFNISADPTEALSNMGRFRGLVSKDLGAMGAEFQDWSTKVFGDLTTVAGGFTALAAALAAGAVAAAGALSAAADKAATFALEIGKGSQRTGIAAEDMSRLRYAAEVTRVQYDSLVMGLTRFAGTIDKARDSTSQQAAAFRRMGISQAEVEAGSRDMLPLFYRVTDAFHDQMTKVERTAMARELFSRGGVELVGMLGRGSEALREFGDEAQRLGLIMSGEDVIAAKELKAELHQLKAMSDAVALSFGKWAIPIETNLMGTFEAFMGGMKAAMTGGSKNFIGMMQDFGSGFMIAARESINRINRDVKAGMDGIGEGLEAPGKAAKEATQDFWGLTNILEQLKMKFAGTQGEAARISEEMSHLELELAKATAEFNKLREAGKLDPEAIKRETAAIEAMWDAMGAAGGAQFEALIAKQEAAVAEAAAKETERLQKHNAEIAEAETDLERRLLGQREKRAGGERAAWDLEIAQLTEHLQKRNLLTAANQALLAELEKAGQDKIARERGAAFVRELETLQGELAGMLTARQTSTERIKWMYDQDLVKFSEVEEAKTLKLAGSEAEREAISRQYDMNRGAAFARYGDEMTAVYNSQGWRGLFGSEFAQGIRGNEQLSREWAYSTKQSHMLLRVSSETLKESLQKTFGALAQGMGQGIAQALIYEKSVGKAMKAAALAALESLASQSIAEAIFMLAYGFKCLALKDPVGASQSFTSAAIFGTVGAAAAVAGRALAPKSAGEAAGAGAGSTAGASTGAAAGEAGATGGTTGPRIAIYIQGHVVGRSGIEELTDIINEAVVGRDVRLVATAVKQVGAVAR